MYGLPRQARRGAVRVPPPRGARAGGGGARRRAHGAVRGREVLRALGGRRRCGAARSTRSPPCGERYGRRREAHRRVDDRLRGHRGAHRRRRRADRRRPHGSRARRVPPLRRRPRRARGRTNLPPGVSASARNRARRALAAAGALHASRVAVGDGGRRRARAGGRVRRPFPPAAAAPRNRGRGPRHAVGHRSRPRARASPGEALPGDVGARAAGPAAAGGDGATGIDTASLTAVVDELERILPS